MRRFFLPPFLGLIMWTLSQCGHSPSGNQTNGAQTESDTYSEMAKAMCDCLTPMAEKVKEITEYSNQQDMGALEALLEEMETLADEAEKCADREAAKYGEPADEEKANEALKKACPEIAGLLDGLEDLQ